MKKKLLPQDLSVGIAQKEGLSPKEATLFVRTFFDLIEEGLMTEKFVKIKGLGTFKLVTVSERESVNINTGERFQISGHSKVSFTPDPGMKELVNRPFAHFEAVDLSNDTSPEELDGVDKGMEEASLHLKSEMSESEDESTTIEEEEDTETVNETRVTPKAITSGQNAISPDKAAESETGNAVHSQRSLPEESVTSIEADSSSSNSAATPSAPPATETDKSYYPEAEDTDPNATPLPKDEPPSIEGIEEGDPPSPNEAEGEAESPHTEGEQSNTPDHAQPDPEEIVVTSPQRVTDHIPSSPIPPTTVEGGDSYTYTYKEGSNRPKRNHWKALALVLLVFILMGASYFAGYFRMLCPCSYPFIERFIAPEQKESIHVPTATHKKQAKKSERKQAPVAPDKETTTARGQKQSQQTDTPANTHKPGSGKEGDVPSKEISESDKSATPTQSVSRPHTHTVKKGENLSRIARRYYGTDKQVQAILKANQIKDPNTIVPGMNIILP